MKKSILIKKIATEGIKLAGESIYSKYLHEIVENEQYSSILQVINDNITQDKDRFNVKDIKEKLSAEEENLIDNLIIEAEQSGVIERIEYMID